MLQLEIRNKIAFYFFSQKRTTIHKIASDFSFKQPLTYLAETKTAIWKGMHYDRRIVARIQIFRTRNARGCRLEGIANENWMLIVVEKNAINDYIIDPPPVN